MQYGSPEMAAKIVNTIAKVYIKVDMEEKNEHIHNLRIFLKDQSVKSKQRLTKVEEELKTFKEKGETTGIALIVQKNIANLETKKL